MTQNSLLKPALFVVCLVTVVVLCFEIYYRSQGMTIAYDDGPPLWSHTRAMVYEPSEKTIVFIGSSRIKYDLDIATWEHATGIHAVQLAIEGSCPRPVLEDLANDPNFKGRLVIDVTEGLFFNNNPPNQLNPNKDVKYFHEQTPAQEASFALNKVLESGLVVLDKDHLSLNAKLDELELASRPGVFMMPIFPLDFDRCTFERQMYMSPKFLKEPALQNQVKAIWAFFAAGAKMRPPMPDQELDAIFTSVKKNVAKIQARGGQVLFVRTPSSGPYWQGELMGFPRAKYWERLLTTTGCPGIHFKDYPAIDHFECPEFSHLKKADAVVFTKNFIKILKEKGWNVSASN